MARSKKQFAKTVTLAFSKSLWKAGFDEIKKYSRELLVKERTQKRLELFFAKYKGSQQRHAFSEWRRSVTIASNRANLEATKELALIIKIRNKEKECIEETHIS